MGLLCVCSCACGHRHAVCFLAGLRSEGACCIVWCSAYCTSVSLASLCVLCASSALLLYLDCGCMGIVVEIRPGPRCKVQGHTSHFTPLVKSNQLVHYTV